MLNQQSETWQLISKKHQTASHFLSAYFVIFAEVTSSTLPFGILEIVPLGVLSVRPAKPLSHSGLSQHQSFRAEEMGDVGHHVRMDLKTVAKYRLS